ncbi:CBD9-like protein [Terfezia boudieri ATCC MYA-4762]|uniref:CBD9-like protein n=1 Tax=Terfezia boudieri ATCC MYA-4762 TaxID=1051890 RepID=A0A3N4LSV4_9PEZI|nr:CBD9-like protein [Terfezia boudieri ATCC MYA-4762]
MFSLKDLSATLLTWGMNSFIFLFIHGWAKWGSIIGAVANAYCSGVNVCATAVVPQTNSQDLYLQITAPSDSGWAGVGLGSRMKGATIFVIYPNAAKTNLTLSPRTGKGEFEPEHDSSIDATVLGVDVTSTNADFIYAQGGGNSVSGDQPDTSIYQHGTRGQFTMNLVAVTKTTSGNPFDATTNTSGNNTNSSTSDDSNTTGDGGNGGESSQSKSEADRTLRAHGMAYILLGGFITSFL